MRAAGESHPIIPHSTHPRAPARVPHREPAHARTENSTTPIARARTAWRPRDRARARPTRVAAAPVSARAIARRVAPRNYPHSDRAGALIVIARVRVWDILSIACGNSVRARRMCATWATPCVHCDACAARVAHLNPKRSQRRHAPPRRRSAHVGARADGGDDGGERDARCGAMRCAMRGCATGARQARGSTSRGRVLARECGCGGARPRGDADGCVRGAAWW